VATVKKKKDAVVIAEELYESVARRSRRGRRAGIVVLLPRWVRPWLKECDTLLKAVPVRPFERRCEDDLPRLLETD